ncbi:alpha-1,6-mannosyl-glycoprotein 2-beta-N-acetylglucosaminyltransferase-like [Homarus americanus]|nr:alpha-1,6-mannosyl-glycoprotein 2-beta-N-acetylglucosaminyltransferase-like [Homarus americanus]
MKAVTGINETLVIFSHDLWDPAINALVRNIKDFRAMQMFFPFSIQLHAHTFPGIDPRDCARNTSRQSSGKCLGHPDTYGHYREAPLTQIKHHWWWKIHRVFEEVRVTRESAGWVVFLEEDHYLAPDLLHVLHRLLRDKDTLCRHCQVIALGNYNKLNGFLQRNTVTISDWLVTTHNLGYSLNRNAWNLIKECRELFCTFDDYNWDWTLYKLVLYCTRPRLTMLGVSLSRVLHVGSCGTHTKRNACDTKSEVQSAAKSYHANAHWLFPASLQVLNKAAISVKLVKPNGGWGDHRDQELCRAIANNTTAEDSLLSLKSIYQDKIAVT